MNLSLSGFIRGRLQAERVTIKSRIEQITKRIERAQRQSAPEISEFSGFWKEDSLSIDELKMRCEYLQLKLRLPDEELRIQLLIEYIAGGVALAVLLERGCAYLS